jgi:hypothetical protein
MKAAPEGVAEALTGPSTVNAAATSALTIPQSFRRPFVAIASPRLVTGWIAGCTG